MRGLAEDGMTMIVVTHEMGFAREVGDALVFMDEGVVVESGRPRDVLTNPQHRRTRTFLSKVLWAEIPHTSGITHMSGSTRWRDDSQAADHGRRYQVCAEHHPDPEEHRPCSN